MHSLNKIQVNKIAEDVRIASITLSHLADDLIDHICCEVENLIEEGKSFEQAYEIVKKQTGISVLQKIQDDTKFLIDKKYRRMKTTMKITGNISLGVIMFGALFKIMHWPGAGPLLVLGFFILCTIFFPLAIRINYKDANNRKNLLLHLALLFGGIIFMVGVLFKIMHWPFAGPLLLVGELSLLFLVLPLLLFIKIKKSESSKDKRIYVLGVISLMIFGLSSLMKIMHWPGAAVLMLLGSTLLIAVFLPMFSWRRIQLEGKITGQFIYIILVSMFLVLFTSLLTLNVSKDYQYTFFSHADNLTLKNNYLENKNASIINDIESKIDTLELKLKAKIIQDESDNLCEYISNIQVDLIMQSEQVDRAKALEMIDNTRMMKIDYDWKIVYVHMIGGKMNGNELKNELIKYKSTLNSNFDENKEFTALVSNLFDVSDRIKNGYMVTWEEYYFNICPVVRAISTLNELVSNIRIAESEALQLTNNKFLTLNSK